ncbi:MAG: ATPase [Halobacteriovorax sp.]|nr:ATPase [Halobacteriovorax sp.]|tara:strand:+ start:446282 stop:447232 length:951 start_codon:yes stop_codon:yes gene_type:complete
MEFVKRENVLETLDKAKSIIYGQDVLLDSIIAALVCEGHLLIEGMPGLGKTLSVSVISKLCDLSFQRIQFTPDLLPSDLIGTMIYSQQKEEFNTKFGPIFTQLLLADEINRSPAKVQSALLEAMAEKQVTIGDKTHKLSSPFVVLATQNPIDQEGTYTLPEAQMDRFMMKVNVDYPDFEAETKILDLSKTPLNSLEPLLATDDLLQIQKCVDEIYVDDKLKNLIVRIVSATRPGSDYFVKEFEGGILAGASPRACIWLQRVGKFIAYMDGKDYVSPDHLMRIIPDVLGHRILMTYEAEIDGITGRDAAIKIASKVI